MRGCSRLALVLAVVAAPVLANGTLEVRGAEAGSIGLSRHVVDGAIRDQLAEVTVEQVFVSRAAARVEGVYVFPLPPGASVSAFEMTVDGKTMRGEIVERDKAKRIYEDIVRRQRDPALLEKLDHETFRARVFPIDPGKEILIRLTYQQLLDDHDGKLALRYPLARERLAADEVGEVTLRFAVESSIDLLDVSSPSHALEVGGIGKRHATFSWTGRDDAQARDFLLEVRRDPEAIGFTLLGHRDAAGLGTFLAIFSPPTRLPEDELPPRDVVYVLDTSGSMEGGKLAQAQAALARGIDLLRPADRFRVIAFSTEVRSLHETWMPATAEWRRIAREWIGGQKAGGGTAIDEALTAALATGDPGRLGLVVFLTDGLPTVGERDPKRIVANLKAVNRASMRVFCFGVGFDQGVPFLDEIATTTRASREYVAQGEDLEPVLDRFFDRIQQPALVDLRVDWGDGARDVYPRPLPDLFAGDRLVVAGRYDAAGPRVVRLHGTRLGKELVFTYEGSLPERGGVDAVPRLWAQRKIGFLEAEIDRHGASPELKDEIVALGTQHHIVTRYTAGLVVEDGAEFTESVAEVPPEAVAGTPIPGPSTNSAIGLGGGAGGRARGGRRNLRAHGGSGLTENAVELGLWWLRDWQHADGSYGSVADTSMALLSLLGAGYTDRGSASENRYAKQVRDGLRWLMARQGDDGRFSDDPILHAQATLALAEAFGMTRNPRYRKPAQDGLDRLARMRARDGGWGDDVLTTTWALSALVSGRFAGLEVDPDGFAGARRLYEAKAASDDPTEQAAMLFGRIFLGEDPRGSRALQALMDKLEPHAPEWRDGVEAPVDLWYFGTLAAYQFGGPAWKRWNEALRETIAKGQTGRSAAPEHAGSWPLGGDPAARIADQAKLNLCLEVYYRYDRVFGTVR